MDVLARPLGPVADAARRLRGVQRAMTRLESLDSVARLMSAAPREACRAIGCERAMLSQIRGDRVSFVSVSFEADPVLGADFARLARAVRPRLERCAPEHEAVVRQAPVLVRDAWSADGLFGPLTRVARTAAYVVAPIVRDGQTVGLLHADRFGDALGELERELLGAFATGLGWAMEDVAGRGGRAGGGLGAAELGGALGGDGSGFAAVLSVRQLEVLRLMAEGASSSAIGARLALSPVAVAAQVGAILRTLGAANRTEAVGLFLATG